MKTQRPSEGQKCKQSLRCGLCRRFKKISKDLLGEIMEDRKPKKKRKYPEHQNVIETKEHRTRTLFKNIFDTHFSVKCYHMQSYHSLAKLRDTRKENTPMKNQK